jgi:serine/threonine protein kinase
MDESNIMVNKMVVKISEINALCINCFKHKGNHSPCSHCGYDEHQYKAHPLYLKPKIILENQYIIGLPLGQGGFGITYLGQDLWLQKKVAIKEYLPAFLATRDVQKAFVIPLKKQENTFNKGLQLFIEEARNLAKFDHPNIVRVIHFFEANQTGYMVMDYLEGLNPIDFINKAGGRLPINEALAIISPILDALAAIHAQNIYHRDISLQNIRILNTGIPILIDFGAARHIVGEQSHTLDLVLKHGYSPLEQYSGKGKIGPWTDIYACGALLYLMMTGTLPSAATDRFCQDNIITPIEMGIDISPTVNDAIMQALAIKFEDRFQTIQEFKAALQGHARNPLNPPKLLPHIQSYAFHSQKAKKFNFNLVVMSVFFFLMIGISFVLMSKNPLLFIKLFATQEKILTENQNIIINTLDKVPENKPMMATSLEKTETKPFKMVEYYQQLAVKAQQQGQWQESLTIIQQGLQIIPTYAPLLALEQSVKAHLADQQKMKDMQIKQLLTQATQYLAMSQLQAAYVVYQEILALQPHHQLAQSGLQQVSKKYVQLIQTLKGPPATRLAFLNKGLTMFPEHHNLLQLKKVFLDEQRAEKRNQDTKQSLERKISQWLQQAEHQMAALRLTTPNGDNAYETYQHILRQEPNHLQAQAGLTKIADKYEQLARINRNDLHKNLSLIEKGLKVLPTHLGLKILRQEIMQKMQRVTKSPQVISQPGFSASQPQIPTRPSRFEDKSEDLTKIEPSPQQFLAPDKSVQHLLTKAKQHLKMAEFKAASQLYQHVLTIEPENLIATTSLQTIANRYEQLAKIQHKQGYLQKSLALIKQGLTAYPSPRLLALQAEITRHLNEKTLPSTPNPHLIFTPSF